LLSNGAHDADFESNYAGFLGTVAVKEEGIAPDMLAVTFGIYVGSFCGYDDTVLLYSRKPLRRLARIIAQPTYSPNGSHLREVVVGPDEPGKGRLVGSAWVLSNCTSNWNGENLRIDRLRGATLQPLTSQAIGAFAGEPVTIRIQQELVTVGYTTNDTQANLIPATERYRIERDRAVKLPEPSR
jgi:hypothetical protein